MGDGRFRVLLRNASTEDKENAASLKITLADFDGIAQVWYYIVMVTNGLDGIIIGELSTTGNYGGQLFISDAGIKYRKLSSGTYGAWNKLITNADLISSYYKGDEVTINASGATDIITKNISSIIPSGCKIFTAFARAVNNAGGVINYVTYTENTISYRIRNLTNAPITVIPYIGLIFAK